MKAFRIDQQDGKIVAGMMTMEVNDLTEGEVII